LKIKFIRNWQIGSVTIDIKVSSAAKNNWESFVPLSQIRITAWLKYSDAESVINDKNISY